MIAPLVFIDTETTGLDLDDDIWEVAVIRRLPPDGIESVLHLFIEHDTDRCQELPEPFHTDHRRRYDHREAVSRLEAARRLAEFIPDGAHVVGSVPNFDTERLARLLRRETYQVRWHYHLIDVENLAVGFLHGLQCEHDSWCSCGATHPNDLLTPPWNSEQLSRAIGVTPPGDDERHTALGDARWAMRMYDRVMGDAR